MDKHLTNAACQASSLDPERFWNHRAVVDGRQRRRCSWRRADELLEHTDVEHVVKASVRRKLQAHGDIVDELDDAVRADEAGLELARGRPGEGGGGTLSKTKKSPIANLVGHRPMLSVVVALLHGLRLLQAVAHVGEESLTGFHVLGDCGNTSLTGLVRADGWRVTAVHHAKWRLTERGLVRRVVDVLSPR